ncbi:MAG TPA: TetR/AcrR family transcriptional regulator [Mycobacterium sp.]|nr:TetR/AcrR family transcriptional regulator [Mycobacterium sp.]HTX96125.1 TetR/AcrR family transcriptional regulator [Mycobacterium sp.]
MTLPHSTDELGLRDRKRQRTRQALISAAMRLFKEKGYEQTTVAEIAAAAEVSTKTFFNHFASKDEVLFPHLSARIDDAVAIIEQRQPDDNMPDVLVKAMEHMLADAVRDELDGGLASVRLPMIVSVPSVQAATLHRYFQAETRLARALHDAYPDLLDAPAAGAVIGSLMGSALAAALICLQRGDTTERVQAAARQAIGIAMAGLHSMGNKPSTAATRSS